MTKEQMEQIVQRQLDAYNRRDLKAFCDCYHSEVKVTNLIANNIGSDGKEKFTAVYKGLFESSPKLHCELKSRIVLASAVIDEEWVTGAAKYPNGLHAVAVYGFRDGLIDRVWFPR
jgi:hypothetical protein